MTQQEEAKELYWCKGPKDVWLDAPVIKFIKTHQIANGTPRHERDRILCRAEVYAFNKGELHRKMPDGTMCGTQARGKGQANTVRARAAWAFWS